MIVEKNTKNFQIKSNLKKAFEKNEFRVFYQPKLDLTSGKVVGVEALIRWEHPELGLIPPLEFIPYAEKTGFITFIGEWVLRTACQQNVNWQKASLPPMTIAVNLSANQLYQPHIAKVIQRILEETGLSPEYLELEITESTLMDVHRVLPILQEIKRVGVQIGLDDFGTGFSSLQYLREFPIDFIKIDRSFIRNCTVDSKDETIVKAIIATARQLKLKVIAEGIETKEQLIYLQQNFCNRGQGYFFSKPIPSQEFELEFKKIEQILNQKGIPLEFNRQKWLEEELELSRQELRNVIRYQQGMIFKFTKKNGKFIHTLVDGELLYKMGLIPEQIIDRELFDFLPTNEAERKLQYYRRAWDGEENVLYEGNLNDIWYLASLRPLRKGGQVVEVISSCVEITERKKGEELLLKTEKLSVAGQLAKGFAHEIRNPLTSIKGFVQLLQEEYPSCYTDIIMKEIESMEGIVDNFLALTKIEESQMEEMEGKILLQDTLQLFKLKSFTDIEFKIISLVNHPMIYCDSNQIKRVFFHILQNATEAMPHGGTIKIQILQEKDDFITFRFIDQGHGISKERMKHIGQPFYCNSEKGMGLGLTLSQKIVHGHGGTINIESKKNKGTIVDVILPIYVSIK